MDAVDEIDVKVAGGAVHHFGAGRSAFGGVAGQVEGAVVGFGLGDAEGGLGSVGKAAQQSFADEVTGDFYGGTIKKGEWEVWVHACIIAGD